MDRQRVEKDTTTRLYRNRNGSGVVDEFVGYTQLWVWAMGHHFASVTALHDPETTVFNGRICDR